MRKDAIQLEEARLVKIEQLDDYQSIHERHRIFPNVFEKRQHKRMLDLAAGVGVVGRSIRDNYESELVCNDICPKCLSVLKRQGLSTISFDIDDNETSFPYPDNQFDAVIALATIEHVIHIDHFVREIYRILDADGYLYLSAPNYSGLPYLVPFLLTGKTFHDPLSNGNSYEFYAHVRYFTYRTLVEYVTSFGFQADTVYLPVPQDSSKYQKLKASSPLRALAFRYAMSGIYTFLSPRWASEPVICFRKKSSGPSQNIRKVVL